ncbi:polysaccharide biosynthesis/export family protein [Thalassotalea profundi]|uniref:Polysaccharide export protein n=1 Tax=Thalassotalea profundi TaxID=2036687 RepID=A0ABQ3J359_9GAMM|nr:polysaccharide biosynthesis/export family protein [Thalassotalea profundi]GHF02605.1 hypothetical protein GCM10011501_34940 [Thalassotalea profundi]
MKKIKTFSALILTLISFYGFSSSYTLGSGDQIEITVYGEPDLTTKVKIDKSGIISFPFIGDIQVIGTTTKLLEKHIYEGLLGDYLIEPQVTVSVVSYRPFFIHGQVKRPGGYPFQDDLTLDKAIALAGGLANRASSSDWKITRIVDGSTTTINATVSTLILPDDIIKIEQSFF